MLTVKHRIQVASVLMPLIKRRQILRIESLIFVVPSGLNRVVIDPDFLFGLRTVMLTVILYWRMLSEVRLNLLSEMLVTWNLIAFGRTASQKIKATRPRTMMTERMSLQSREMRQQQQPRLWLRLLRRGGGRDGGIDGP